MSTLFQVFDIPCWSLSSAGERQTPNPERDQEYFFFQKLIFNALSENRLCTL
jgi:hypothetical protein